MRTEEIRTTEAYDLSPHQHAFINPYYGCSMGCPFCYWLTLEGWENRIQIKMNIAEVLEQKLADWNPEEPIYLGSVCDPYNELEKTYSLSRKCLEIIRRRDIPLVITTSCIRDTILRDLDLLKEMRVIIVVELARIPMFQQMEQGGRHMGIEYANRLKAEGLKVYTTLAPICPGMMEPESVMDQLDVAIPIYVDCLRCEPGSILADRTKAWIQAERPDLIPMYENVLDNQDYGYFEEYLERYGQDDRIRTFPFELNFTK